MSMSIGCVGCGNMGGAILAGLAASSLDCTLYGHTRTAARMAPLEAAGVTRLDSAGELARKARYVVMAVKPYQIEALLAGMEDVQAGRVTEGAAAIQALKEKYGI